MCFSGFLLWSEKSQLSADSRERVKETFLIGFAPVGSLLMFHVKHIFCTELGNKGEEISPAESKSEQNAYLKDKITRSAIFYVSMNTLLEMCFELLKKYRVSKVLDTKQKRTWNLC